MDITTARPFLARAAVTAEMGKPIEVFYDRVLTTVRRREGEAKRDVKAAQAEK